MNSKTMILFVEFLNVASVQKILSYLKKNKSSDALKSVSICYFDATLAGKFLLKSFLLSQIESLKRAAFESSQLKDQRGLDLRLSVEYFGTEDLCFSFLETFDNDKELSLGIPAGQRYFFFKKLSEQGFCGEFSQTNVVHALFVLEVCRSLSKDQNRFVVFLHDRPYKSYLMSKAHELGGQVFFTGQPLDLIENFKRRTRNFVKKVFYLIFSASCKLRCSKQKIPQDLKLAKLMVPYYGHYYIDRPELFSDLFFVRDIDLFLDKILFTTTMTRSRLSIEHINQLKQNGISPLALSPRAIDKSVEDIRFDLAIPPPSQDRYIDQSTRHYNGNWRREFVEHKEYWQTFFKRQNVRLYTHWYKFDASHVPLAEALRSLGGIMTLYLRAFEGVPTPQTAVNVDVMFGFSSHFAKVEKGSGSLIPYYVITGFLGDYRFSYLKPYADKIRLDLMKRGGCKKIISFFDENTFDDARWYNGHSYAQMHYSELLNRVLKDRKLGLVIKAKNHVTLRKRLGDVAKLIDELKSQGRCHMFDYGDLQGAYPPAVAALASDLAIHEDLSAGSAGVEAALCGVPTLLLDTENWKVSPLYKLGKGKVVFNNWQELWEASQGFLHNSGCSDGFGDWGDMLNELDPFRDGRAAERMGWYLSCLLDGLRAGGSRENVLADVAHQYMKIWGKDKIVSSINI